MQVALGAEAETAAQGLKLGRTLPFISLVLVDLGLVLVNRCFALSCVILSASAIGVLIWISAVTVSMLVLILALPLGREMFGFDPLHGDDLLLVVAAAAGVVAVMEGLKRFWRTRLAR